MKNDRHAGFVVLWTAWWMVPGSVIGQVGPEFPADGFLEGEPVPFADAVSECATTLDPSSSDVISYSTCAVAEVDTFRGVHSGTVLAARYLRWVRSAEFPWLDSMQVDEVVLFEPTRPDAQVVRAVWRRVGYYNFLSLLEWGHHAGVDLLQLYNCVRGTGGCVEDLLLRDETGWHTVEPTFVAELEPHIPEGYRLHKGRSIELSTLRFEQPIATQGDPNCCPSAALAGTLRLDGRRLRLASAQLAR